ncbi:hypothetical protein N0V88_007051 [Collariella sp. IMI 366227]|nr:hypothetical protein N0V88_007051 [Collariella sp. IMI 366227]
MSSFTARPFRCCNPGGYIEQQEPSMTWESEYGIPKDNAIDQFFKISWEGGKTFGRSFRVFEDNITRKDLEVAGFVDVVINDI